MPVDPQGGEMGVHLTTQRQGQILPITEIGGGEDSRPPLGDALCTAKSRKEWSMSPLLI